MRSIKFVEHNDEYDSYYSFVENDDGLKQHGVMGMHWGQRKYQNKDGSLTPAGRIHYGVGAAKRKAASVMEKAKRTAKTIDDSINSANDKIAKKLKPVDDKISEKTKPINDLYNNTNDKITEKMKPVDDFANKVSDKMANVFSAERRAENKVKKEAEKAEKDKQELKKKIDNSRTSSGATIENKFIGDLNTHHDLDKAANDAVKEYVKNEVLKQYNSNNLFSGKYDKKVIQSLIDAKFNDKQYQDMVEAYKNSVSDERKEYDKAELEKLNKPKEQNDIVEGGPTREYIEARKDYVQWVGEPATDENAPTGTWEYKYAKEQFGLDKKDLVILDGEVVRKDGEPFVYKFNGKKYNCLSTSDAVRIEYRHEAAREMYYEWNISEETMNKINRIESLDKSGFSVKEIAKKLGIPEGTVSSYLYGENSTLN